MTTYDASFLLKQNTENILTKKIRTNILSFEEGDEVGQGGDLFVGSHRHFVRLRALLRQDHPEKLFQTLFCNSGKMNDAISKQMIFKMTS